MKTTCKNRVTSMLLRRVLMASALILAPAAALINPRPASAQIVCANCSTIIQQILEYATQLLQWYKQLEQYQTQLDQLADQLKNSMPLEGWYFDRALDDIRGIEWILASGSNIVYSMQNLDQIFMQQYPDFMTVFGTTEYETLTDSFNRHAQESQQIFDGARGALKAAKAHSEAMQQEQLNMDNLANSLMGANGRLDAIQAAGTYAQNSAQQIMKLRQIALMQVQLQAERIANDQRVSDQERAELFRMLSKRPTDPRDTGIGPENFQPGTPPGGTP